MFNRRDELNRQDLSRSTFIGFVVDNNDPRMLQRVRVRIPDLHRGIDDKNLPWAISRNSSGQGAVKGIGQVNVPVVGSKVMVSFLQDDPHMLMYVGAPVTEDVVSTAFKENYPHSYGTEDAAGNLFIVDTKTGDVRFVHNTGAVIEIDGSGNITVKAAKSLTLAAPDGIKLSTQGNIKIESGDNITMASPGAITVIGAPVDINPGGGSATSPEVKTTKRPRPTVKSVANKKDL